MNATGINIEGVNIITKRSLKSIGDIVFHVDDGYPDLLNLTADAIPKVRSWYPVDSNYGIAVFGQGVDARRPRLYADGVGWEADGTLIPNMGLGANSFGEVFRTKFCTYDPWVLFTIGKKVNPGGDTTNAGFQSMSLRDAANTVNRMYSRPLIRQGQVIFMKGSTQTTASAAVPDNEQTIIAQIYYGDLGGADNVRQVTKTTNTPFLNSAAPAADANYPQIVQGVNFTTGSTMKIYFNKILTYALPGKSVTDINNFVQLAFDVIREDQNGRYSSLILNI